MMEAKCESPQVSISRKNMYQFISNICCIANDMLQCRDDLALRDCLAKLTFLRVFVRLADNEGMGSLLNCIHDYTLKIELQLFNLWTGKTMDRLASSFKHGGINVDKPCSLLIIFDVFKLSNKILLDQGMVDWDSELGCVEATSHKFVSESLPACIPKFLDDIFRKDCMKNSSIRQELEDVIKVLHGCLQYLGTFVEDLSLDMQLLFARAIVSIGFLWVFDLQDFSKQEIKHVRFQLSILTTSLYISAAEIALTKQHSYEPIPIIFMMELHKQIEDGLKILRECLTLEDKVRFLPQWEEVVPHDDILSFLKLLDDCEETDHALSKLLGTTRLIQAHVLALQLLNRGNEFRLKDQVMKLSGKLGVLVGHVNKFSESALNQILFWLDTAAIATEVADLISSFSMESGMTEEMLQDGNIALVRVMSVIEVLEAELMLNGFLLHRHAYLIDFFSRNIGTLRNGFRFLRIILTDSTEQDKELLVLSYELVKVAIPLVSNLFHNMSRSKSMTIVEDLLRNMIAWETNVTDRYRQIRLSSQPTHSRTDMLGFIDCLVDNLSILSNSMPALPRMKYQLGRAFSDLKSCRSLLNDIAREQNEDNELNDLVSQLTQAAYEVEYVAEAFAVGDGNTWSKLLWISDLNDEIKQIAVKIEQVVANQSYKDGGQADNPSGTSLLLPVDNTTQSTTDEVVVVGMEEQEEKVTNQLVRGSTKLGIVSIVGMGGLGKTSLAKKVFDSPSVQNNFYVRAWCCISKVYSKREILLEILGYATEITPEIQDMSNDDLSNRLRQLLLERRYLIVMDDMWDMSAWKELQQSFPKGHKQSRILITSRINDIASKSGYGLEPCILDLLSDSQSWKLLERKLFKDGSCPLQFREVGWEIAVKCKGLPLAIVVISGLLSTKEMNLDWWKQVAGNLNSIVVGNTKTFTNIIDLSYRHLPDYLKPCFLYFSMFHEDERIIVSNLIDLWTAEGFIRKKANVGITDVARDYLQELVSRNLVIVVERTSIGGIKACRLHDILHELCCTIAEEERFLHVVKDMESNAKYEHHRRVCIYSERKTFVESRLSSGQGVRTLVFFPTRRKEGESSLTSIYRDTSFISLNFKLLRTLKLDSLKIGDTLPQGFELLIHLRFLAVMGIMRSIPDSIQCLSNLEFFYVKGLRGEIELPHGIWKSKKLRNLRIMSRFAFRAIIETVDGRSSHLDNLESLSTLFLPYKGSGHILQRLSKLHKLKCILSGNEFPDLTALNQLESLKAFYHGIGKKLSLFNIPETLKKLTLSKFRLRWKKISTIGKLPCLEVLKLQSNAFEGEEWKVGSDEFTNLKYLKLDSLDIVRWNTSDDDEEDDWFPCLEKLVFQNCKQLEEIPIAFEESSTLQTIQMQWCNGSLAKYIRCIRDQQMETTCRNLNVFIHPSHF